MEIDTLEKEKENFLKAMNLFLDGINLEVEQYQGRPRVMKRDVVKCLLVKTYHQFSYRRAMYDIEDLFHQGKVNQIIQRPTLIKYMLDPELTKELQKLIGLSSLSFVNKTTCIIFDSTWFPKMLRLSGNTLKERFKGNIKIPSFVKTMKLHVSMCRDTKIITHAIPSIGTAHDSPFFKELLEESVKLGFKIDELLADKGYLSKDSYKLAEEYGIKAFIDFRANVNVKRGGSKLWAQQLILSRENPKEWKESYRNRVLVESLFSTIKRKWGNYLRSRNETAEFNEMLLLSLVHNLTVIGKEYCDIL